jgi:hypothetical protein
MSETSRKSWQIWYRSLSINYCWPDSLLPTLIRYIRPPCMPVTSWKCPITLQQQQVHHNSRHVIFVLSAGTWECIHAYVANSASAPWSARTITKRLAVWSLLYSIILLRVFQSPLFLVVDRQRSQVRRRSLKTHSHAPSTWKSIPRSACGDDALDRDETNRNKVPSEAA